MDKLYLDILETKGWIELQGVNSDDELMRFAKDIGKLVKHPNGELIMKLNPKCGRNSIKGTLSSRFGYSSFPLHTDTAFWNKPARYMILSSNYSNSCDTLIAPLSDIWKLLTEDDIKDANRAIYLIANKHEKFYLSLIFKNNGIQGLRFDNACMKPFNASAIRFHSNFEKALAMITPNKIKWTGNKMIIIDNWKTLHGRSFAGNDLQRELKRIYIN